MRDRVQIHLIPRPGKSKARHKPRVFEASSKFSFHQIHAWENSKGAVVVDVLGKDYQDFKLDLDNLPVSNFERSETQTYVRRVVCEGDTGKAVEYNVRDSAALRWRYTTHLSCVVLLVSVYVRIILFWHNCSSCTIDQQEI